MKKHPKGCFFHVPTHWGGIEISRRHIMKKQENVDNGSNVLDSLNNRKTTYHGIYCDVAVALEKFSTSELVNYYINILGYEDNLRNYLEEKIIADEIYKSKMKNDIACKEEEQEILR